MVVHVITAVVDGKPDEDPIVLVCATENEAMEQIQFLLSDYEAGQLTVKVEPQYLIGHFDSPVAPV